MKLPAYTPTPSPKTQIEARSARMEGLNNLSKGGGKIVVATTGNPPSDGNIKTSVELMSRMEKVDHAQKTGGRRRKFRRRTFRRTFRRRRRR